MPSFVPPQVDHNLYTPILPQDNVTQIFGLLDQKQELYNQGVKVAQNKISSMLNLENEVTSGPIKEMVTDFNEKANNLVKQYANLDFSLQSNVSLIDNIYNPLMDNELFLNDYTATKHHNTQAKKAFSYRDSDKKEIRDLFNTKNLNYLNIAKQNLAGAKTEREIKTYSSQLKNTYYTPYYDVKAEIMEAYNKNKDRLTISTDYVNGQYIQTVKDGDQLYKSMNAWINTFISDKAKNQLKIEKEVDFYNELSGAGVNKEQFLSSKINSAIESYQKIINENQELLDDYNTKLNSYPPEGKRYPKQQAKVDELLKKITNTQSTIKTASETLADYNDYMDKASKGEIEYSQFYDSAEKLYVRDKVEKELSSMAASLSAFPTTSIKKNDAYFSMLEERRLSEELRWKKKTEEAQLQLEGLKYGLDQQKYYADLAKEGLAYWNGEKWVIGKAGTPGVGGTGILVPTTQEDAQETPTTVDQVNSMIDKNLITKIEVANKAAVEIATSYSSLQGTPLSINEQNQLAKIFKENTSNTPIATLINKYGKNILEKAGLIKTGKEKTLGDALTSMAYQAEEYVKNTAKEQSGNNATYHTALRKALDQHYSTSSVLDMERDNIVRDVKKTYDLFMKDKPGYYKDLFEIDENGKIIQKKQLFKTVTGIGPFSRTTYRTVDTPQGMLILPKQGEQRVDVTEEFNEFLKTQKGTIGRVGSYFKEVIASDANAFIYLKQNKGDIISHPERYHIKDEDEYDKSVYKVGYSTVDNQDELEAYNEMADRFFNSIPDEAYKLENKNLKGYATRIERKRGMEIIYPDEKFLKEIFGLIDKDGKPVDAKNRWVPSSTDDDDIVSDMISKMMKNGIMIKKDTSKDESARTMQYYLDSGLPVKIPRGNGGTNLDFSIVKDMTTEEYKLEGKPVDGNDFFLKDELTYKIENGKLMPSDDGISFYNHTSIVPKLSTDVTIFDVVHPVQDDQIYFMNKKDTPEFIKNLTAYLDKNKIDKSKISGLYITNFINNID